jgi:hypothetical protein
MPVAHVYKPSLFVISLVALQVVYMYQVRQLGTPEGT